MHDDVLSAKPISPSFVGFSIEVGSAPQVFLVNGTGGKPRASFASLLNQLNPFGINTRIGGNSADESAWVNVPDPLPSNSTYRITQADLDAYGAARAWNGTLTLDVTLRYTDPKYALAHVQAALASSESSLFTSFEIGNE